MEFHGKLKKVVISQIYLQICDFKLNGQLHKIVILNFDLLKTK